ncbi:fungal chitosanase of glycosyl hydrolase group 75-domain-containing protein [Aspergillus cavernicola]|uniref:Endo-chitosanase n=1 Tax=Aspergillus cavernicola TaxID=176166 RepID=A0ABR4I5S3_9EURO
MMFRHLIVTSLLILAVSGKAVQPASFAAANTIDVTALLSASERVKSIPDLATYPVNIKEKAPLSTIYNDWASFQDGAALVWKADMDTDCDGINYKCEGNLDGQPLTNWGALSAFEVPFIVIPDKFLQANPTAIPGNNVAAVICDKKMYYAILGDSNFNTPQVTGEASWLLANACFPDAKINGNRGHDSPDVTYILFTGEGAVLPPAALNDKYITDFDKLRAMGDHLSTALLKNLGVPPLSPGSSTHDNDNDNGQGAGDHPVHDTGSDFDSGALVRLAPKYMALLVAVVAFVVT